jgi:ATP-binding cassette, subfamily C, bacterial exporter for protease/lipase
MPEGLQVQTATQEGYRSMKEYGGSDSPPLLHQLLRDAWPGLALVLVFSVVANLLRFVAPIYLIQVFDRVVSTRSIQTLVMLTILAIVGLLTGVSIDIVRRRMLARFGHWLEAKLAPAVVQSSLVGTRGDGEAEPNERLRQLHVLCTFIGRTAVTYTDVLFAPLFIIAVALIHPLLGIIALCGALVAMWLEWLRARIVRRPTESAREASDDARKILTTAQRLRESVVGLAMGGSLLERWRTAASRTTHDRDRTQSLNISFTAWSRGVGRLLRICMIGAGVWLFLDHALSLGSIFAARIMAASAYRSLGSAARNWDRMRDARATYREICDLDASSPTEASFVANDDAQIIADAISFRHRGARSDLFRRLDLTLRPGELLLVTGSAASGKTTLARLLVGLLRPRHGQIRIGDIEILRLPIAVRSASLGYLPQHPEIFEGTMRDNIARFSDCSFEDVIQAARLAGIHDFIIRQPEGYETRMTSQPVGMSGSQRKRIAIARAFLGAPRLIVLDEPLANLDGPSRRRIEAALLELKRNGASVVLTQSMSSSRLSRIADLVLDLNCERPAAGPPLPPQEKSSDKVAKLRRVK